jgi:hypothetical protein
MAIRAFYMYWIAVVLAFISPLHVAACFRRELRVNPKFAKRSIVHTVGLRP